MNTTGENETGTNTTQEQASPDSSKKSLCLPCCCKVDWHFVLNRSKEVLLDPKGCWKIVKEDSRSLRDIYADYLVWIAAIPALIGFVRSCIIGLSVGPISFRMPFVQGLFYFIILAVVQLAAVFAAAYALEKLLPYFKLCLDRFNAFKIVAYSSVPSFLAGAVCLLAPGTSVFGLLAFIVALYSLCLLYHGLKEYLTVAEDAKYKVYGACIATVVVVFVLCFALAQEIFQPRSPAMKFNPNVTIDLDQIEKTIGDIQKRVPKN